MPPKQPARDELPTFLYGTAWKEEATQRLTELALQCGFRGIDTANQRKHYHEAAVGLAFQSALRGGWLTRSEVFLQSKFTFLSGQDQRLPYDPRAPIGAQVQQSFANTLAHFAVESLDSYILHGPSRRVGLSDEDWEAWHAMEALHDSGQVRFLGISNVSLEQLRLLHEQARIKPRFVQNRCYAVQQWDAEIREFCRSEGLIYQGFSLLTANRAVLLEKAVREIARRHDRTASQIVFRFALDVGMLPLTGTTDPEHMRADLSVVDFELTPEEVLRIERVASGRRAEL